MNELEKQAAIDRYNERLDKFGYDRRTLGWVKPQHFLRYHILLSHWDLTNASLLDFGCGFGDLYGYCCDLGIAGLDYLGIDINQRLLEEGAKRYPNAKFSCRDVLAEGLPATYDVIVASGVYNFRLENNWDFIEATLSLFARSARQGFAVNFLSDRCDFKEDNLYYADPCKILDLCYRLSRRIVLRQDYMPFEFTIFVDMRTMFDKDYTIFPDYLSFVPRPEDLP